MSLVRRADGVRVTDGLKEATSSDSDWSSASSSMPTVVSGSSFSSLPCWKLLVRLVQRLVLGSCCSLRSGAPRALLPSTLTAMVRTVQYKSIETQVLYNQWRTKVESMNEKEGGGCGVGCMYKSVWKERLSRVREG